MNHLLTIMEVEKVFVSHLLKRICGEGVSYLDPRTEGEKWTNFNHKEIGEGCVSLFLTRL